MIKAAILGLCLIASSAQAETLRPEGMKMSPEVACLAKNIYHESRGEPRIGQVAVGIVTLQRVASRFYPNTICEVVYQPKAFSWTAQKSPKENKRILYGSSLSAAKEALATYKDVPDDKRIDHFHTLGVDPYWAKTKLLVVQIGNHKFYR